ncbi:M28 family peptidase [Metabacillus herbersteinensis]|uniref:M28 family peptidase n=1 Tax=Metabacillus herbersteinensis TaxID=283816 RepID=A0ABV6GIN3_9BACI
MNNYKFNPSTYDGLLELIEKQQLDEHIKTLTQWERLTGEHEAEQAADYILEQLKNFGVQKERYEFDGYFSDPIHGEVIVSSSENFSINAKARSFSQHCPEGIEGEAVYDFFSEEGYNGTDQMDRYQNFKGKIVVSWNFYEDYVKKIESAGAKGLIHIWPSPETVIHEETVGAIWGTPTIDNVDQLTSIPVVGINNHDGLHLLKRMEKEDTKVIVKTNVQSGIKRVSLPIASIPGKTDQYILVSGHYDSWHKGATDNAGGNALLLELARIFSSEKGSLLRGIKLAWWPGHSNGRYAGSTWYCDHFWNEINENCIAHINVDFPGTKGSINVIPRSSSIEDKRLLEYIIAYFTGQKPNHFAYLPRGADQSFWGTNIPIHIQFKYEQAEKIYQTPGGNWWWHTEEDLYDKIDLELLVRDTKMHISLVHELANLEILPINLRSFVDNTRKIIEEVDRNSDDQFDFTPIHDALGFLSKRVKTLSETEIEHVDAFNNLLKIVGGTLNRLMFSYSSKYEYDNTFPFQPYPGLAKVKNIYSGNVSSEDFLFTMTYFIRQRNRFVNEVREVCCRIDDYLKIIFCNS